MLKRNVQKGMISLIANMMFLSMFSFTNLNSIKTVEAATTAYNTIEYNKSVNLDANIAYPETNAFWSAPYYSEGSTFISSATAPSYAKREAKTERGIYYQVKLGDKIIGWLDK
ncbi:TPA: GW domain-containing glycosaminoglycan-binding protein [Listeria monocytogenes]|nr:GW domain-containing glycosaminoglycan-binding protein [Listeria monocytogenes]